MNAKEKNELIKLVSFIDPLTPSLATKSFIKLIRQRDILGCNYLLSSGLIDLKKCDQFITLAESSGLKEIIKILKEYSKK